MDIYVIRYDHNTQYFKRHIFHSRIDIYFGISFKEYYDAIVYFFLQLIKHIAITYLNKYCMQELTQYLSQHVSIKISYTSQPFDLQEGVKKEIQHGNIFGLIHASMNLGHSQKPFMVANILHVTHYVSCLYKS